MNTEKREYLIQQINEKSAERAECRTFHLFHLIMLFVTGGIWLFVWAFFGAGNVMRREQLSAQIKGLEKEREKLEE